MSELARRTGLGASTVTKALVLLETSGAATRQPGGRSGGRRQPDRWLPAPQQPRKGAAKRRDGVATGTSSGGGGRLGNGELRRLVLDQLRAAGEPAGASMLAGRLGRSAGAVGNALERLVTLGQATLVGDHPRRYQPTPR